MAESDLNSVILPRVDDAQMAALGRCGGARLKHCRAGDKLIEVGQRDFKFFVVKSGEIEILDELSEPPKVLAVLGRGEFTGDVAHLTGGPSLVSAVARVDCDASEVSAEGVREIINRFPDLGDTILQAFMARRHLLRESGIFTGLRVVGSRFSRDTWRIRDFLTKNQIPFTWLDLEDHPEVSRLLEQFGVSEAETPVVAWGHRLLLRNPSDRELAEALGTRRPLQRTVYDLVVIGAGPAGLAAAVYGASEGLDTLVLERAGPGGQAGRSMRIENYLGFPTGVSGGELAERAVVQAGKVWAPISGPTPVTPLPLQKT